MAEWLGCWTRNLVAPGLNPSPCHFPGFVLDRPEFNSLAALSK